jgi:UDP-2-acetamido-3-amino-2,3-dideoxy-glucuronate N-acetyltransferase
MDIKEVQSKAKEMGHCLCDVKKECECEDFKKTGVCRCYEGFKEKEIREKIIEREYIIRNFNNLYGDYEIGKGTKIGSYCDIGGKIGKNCLIQSFVFIPKGVTIEDNCFVGPHTCFTNDKRPPSDNWTETLVKEGASIGANCTILPNIIIGRNAIIGAGSVVTKNVPDGETWYGPCASKKK